MTYRNDHEALEHRRAQLEQELEQVRSERVRLEAAARDEARLVGDLDRVRTELHARAPRRLPLLENLTVASPCHERWDAMVGDAHARHCARCDKNVYDLSSMTRDEAQALLLATEGELCVRYYTRADGTVLTADCPVGLRLKRLRYLAAGAVGLIAAGVMSLTFWQSTQTVRQGGIGAEEFSPNLTPSTTEPTPPPQLLPVGDLRPAPVETTAPVVQPLAPEASAQPPSHPTRYVSPTHEVMGRRVMRPALNVRPASH